MTDLFAPLQLGPITLRNRLFMAPLTRGRATREAVPTPLMVEYYRQRAGAGLIITEATGISRLGLGWPYAPGLWNDAQVEGWKPVTAAVHAEGGRIFAQLWHMGRVVHPSLGGGQPVSASATTAPDHAHTYEGNQPHVEARALRLDEIPGLLEDYRRATRNALAAGFDGVQIHAANGYLIDQFLRDGTNLRTDAYGGSIDNRIRLLREATAAVVEVAGAERTSVRLSPNGEIQGVNDSNPHALFPAAARALSDLGIVFLELREPPPDSNFGKADVPAVAPAIRAAFEGVLVLNSDFNLERAQQTLRAGEADAIAFGRHFLANPDLPRRLREGIALNVPDGPTFYSQGAKGYTDYPFAS
jgi:2,4-dienoyl-CoA reductase-like NADH-dependent reductase (Old Yellow Enzyme family)